MSTTLIAASAIITLALIAYTIGVFAERRAGAIKPRHLAFFWAGLACDSTGTALMGSMAQASGGAVSPLHPATGALAIALMLFHAAWATFVVLRGSDAQRRGFHRLSVAVWLAWLVPYLIGMLVGIPAIDLPDFIALIAAAAVVAALSAVMLPRRDAGGNSGKL